MPSYSPSPDHGTKVVGFVGGPGHPGAVGRTPLVGRFSFDPIMSHTWNESVPPRTTRATIPRDSDWSVRPDIDPETDALARVTDHPSMLEPPPHTTDWSVSPDIDPDVPRIRPFFRDLGQTPILNTLPNTCIVQWKPGFEIGAGFDAITSTVTAPAVQLPFRDLPVIDSEYREIRIYLCKCRESIQRGCAFAQDGSTASWVTLERLTLRAWSIAMAIADLQLVSTSFSLVVWYTRGQEKSYTETIFAHLVQMPSSGDASFRTHHGDYLVAGQRSGRELSAVVTVRCRSAEERVLLERELETFLSATGNENEQLWADIQWVLDIHRHIQTAAHVTVHAYSPSGVPEVIVQHAALDRPVHLISFLDNLDHPRRDLSARLVHYSEVVDSTSNFSREIPVSSDIAQDLIEIRLWLLYCGVMTTAIPNFLEDEERILQIRSDWLDLQFLCLSEQLKFGTSSDRRAELLRLLQGLYTQLSDFYAAYDTWSRAVDFRFHEQHEMRHSGRKVWSWTYGLSQRDVTHLNVQSVMRTTRTLPSSWSEPSSEFLNCRLEDSDHVIGWTVTCSAWRRAWFQQLSPIVLGDTAAIRVSRSKTSSVTWTLTLYVVRNEWFDLLDKYVHLVESEKSSAEDSEDDVLEGWFESHVYQRFRTAAYVLAQAVVDSWFALRCHRRSD